MKKRAWRYITLSMPTPAVPLTEEQQAALRLFVENVRKDLFGFLEGDAEKLAVRLGPEHDAPASGDLRILATDEAFAHKVKHELLGKRLGVRRSGTDPIEEAGEALCPERGTVGREISHACNLPASDRGSQA